ncbi:hypothetical protein STENM327S_00481 [Streptomyces tendae]
MDYKLFVLARMREAWVRTGDGREAVVTGLRRSGPVVTCAALLLAVVSGAFMRGGCSPIPQIGLGLTLAVLIGATVVRMLLVPATTALLGRRARWAPKPLRRAHERFAVREESPAATPPARRHAETPAVRRAGRSARRTAGADGWCPVQGLLPLVRRGPGREWPGRG